MCDYELLCPAYLIQRCVTLSDNHENPNLRNPAYEHMAVLSLLGVRAHQIIIESSETRKFSKKHPQVLEYLLNVHTQSAIHQDHGMPIDDPLHVSGYA